MEGDYKTTFAERFDSFFESEESEIYRNLQALKAIFRVFEGNYHELIEWLEPFKNSEESLTVYILAKELNLEVRLRQTSRLFHNFIASAQSLLDHTNVICTKRPYSSQEFKDEFIAKREKDVFSKPISVFVKRLRNYILHCELPSLGLQISLEEGFDLSIKIDVKILKQWKEWGKGKIYLDSFEDSLCMASFAREWYEIIQNFYAWLNERHLSLYKVQLENFQKMQADFWADQNSTFIQNQKDDET